MGVWEERLMRMMGRGIEKELGDTRRKKGREGIGVGVGVGLV